VAKRLCWGGGVTQAQCRQYRRGHLVPGHRAFAGIFLGRSGTPGGIGRRSRPPAGPNRLTGAPSGGGKQATAGRLIPSVRPPSGARTAKLGRTTYRRCERRLRSGAAFVGCQVRMGAWPASPSRTHPFPCCPPLGRGILGIPLHGTVCRFRVGFHRCLVGVPGAGCSGDVPPAVRRPSWLAPPSMAGRAPEMPRRGPSRKGGPGCGPGGGGSHWWARGL